MRSVSKAIFWFVFLITGASVARSQITQTPSCGLQLSDDAIDHTVPALSNAPYQGKDPDCDNKPLGPPLLPACLLGVDDKPGTCSYGEHYQCVEYIRRFYSLRDDIANRIDTSGWKGHNACDFIEVAGVSGCELSSVNPSETAATPVKGFVAFLNGGRMPPVKDDIIVFSDGGYGHVAVVKDVDTKSSTIHVIEQNWSASGVAKLTFSPGTNIIANRLGNSSVYVVIGWVRNQNVVVNPLPTISSLSPYDLQAGSDSQTLTINGTDFMATSTVAFKNASHQVKFISTNQLTIQLSSADLQVAGAYPVIVVNAAPGGGSSNPVNLTVNNPLPIILNLSPNAIAVGSAAQTLNINGSGFVSDSLVSFNGVRHHPIFINPAQIMVPLSSSDLSVAGTFSVLVSNPAPGGGSSNSVNIVVANVILSPNSVQVPESQVQTFTASTDGGGVIWSVKEGPTGGTITDTGIYTAPSTIGTYHVIATSSTHPTQSAVAAVTVTAPVGFTVFYKFGAFTGDSSGPLSTPNPLVQDSGETFYGTAYGGGNYVNYSGVTDCYNVGCGGIFSLTSSGQFAVLHKFAGTDGAGASPSSTLVAGNGGSYYGTTSMGGDDSACIFNGGVSACGTIFRIDNSGNLTTIHSFSATDGAYPLGSLIFGEDGNLYGTTSDGGDSTSCTNFQTRGCGTVFKSSTSGKVTSLHLFDGTDGIAPGAGLVQANNGLFYGSAAGGGSSQNGTIYKIDVNGTFAVLHSFDGQDGSQPNTSLFQANDGYLYGTTANGGSTGQGTVFRIDTAGNFVSLHSFSKSEGAVPTGLLEGRDGFFYGTTSSGGQQNYGTVFRMDANGSIAVLYSFAGSDGAEPSGIMQSVGGELYGSALVSNGSSLEGGEIFRISF